MKNDIAILIPCLNEELTINKVVQDFQKYLPNARILVFDNNSTDNTANIALEAGAQVIDVRQRGKGYVVKAMFEKVDADIYVLVDGDDTYPANRVSDLIQPIIDGDADMTVGSRLSEWNKTDFSSAKGFKKINLVGNLLYRGLINWIFRTDLKDILSGYRGLNHKVVKTLPLFLKGFEIETELTIKSISRGFRIKEIPIELSERPIGSLSKIKVIKDGIRILRTIISLFRDYKPLTFFGGSGLLLLVLGIILAIKEIILFTSTGTIHSIQTFIISAVLTFLSIMWIMAGVVLHTMDRRYQEIEQTLFTLWSSLNKENRR